LCPASRGEFALPAFGGKNPRGNARFRTTEPGVDHAHARVAYPKRRDAEARHGRRVAGGGSLGDALVPDRGYLAELSHHANEEREPLVVGHLLFDLACPHIGRRNFSSNGLGLLSIRVLP
jgi:hypothetical protein